MENCRDGGVISVVIPVFNRERYLEHCLDSILAQMHASWELLLIDDGSTDSSGEICDRYQRLDSRIRVFHTLNQGVSAARNLGIDMAAGEFVTFVDSDDYLEPHALSQMSGDIARNRADLVCFNRYYVSSKSTRRVVTTSYDGLYSGDEVAELARNMFTYSRGHVFNGSVWSKLFRLCLLEEHNIRFDQDVRVAEDGLFTFQYMLRSKSVYCGPEVLYSLVQSSDSLTRSIRPALIRWGDYVSFLGALEEASGLTDNQGIREAARNVFIRSMHSTLAVESVRFGATYRDRRREMIRVLEDVDYQDRLRLVHFGRLSNYLRFAYILQRFKIIDVIIAGERAKTVIRRLLERIRQFSVPTLRKGAVSA